MLKIKPVILGVVVSLSVFILMLSLIALVSLKTGVMSDELYFWFTSVLVCLAAFSGGFVSGKVAGERVALYGIAVSLLNSLILLIGLFCVFEFDLSVFMIKAALIITASVAGSVVPMLFGRESRYM